VIQISDPADKQAVFSIVSTSDGSNSISPGAIAGIVIGTLVAFIVALFILCLLLRRRRKAKLADDEVYRQRENTLVDSQIEVRYLETPEIQYTTDSKPGHVSTETAVDLSPTDRGHSESTVASATYEDYASQYNAGNQTPHIPIDNLRSSLLIVPPSIHDPDSNIPSSPSSPNGGLVGELISSDEGAQTAVFARPRLVENRLSALHVRQQQRRSEGTFPTSQVGVQPTGAHVAAGQPATQAL
jgi:hypothetical protein